VIVSKPLRIGLIGAGMVSAHHLPAWRELGSQVVLVAIADQDLAKARSCADAYGIEAAYSSVDEMLAAHQLDAVDVMSPPATHATHCSAAAAAGVAILCQKPLAPTWQQANAIAQEVGHRVRLMVHENWRFRPHYRQIAAWLRSGQIGRWHSCAISVRSSGLLRDAEGRIPALLRQPLLAQLPRLMVAEVLVHHVDLAMWMLGALNVHSAWSRCDVPQVLGESSAQIILQDPDGRRVVIDGDMADVRCGPTLRDGFVLQGDRGTIVLQGDTLALQGDLSEVISVDFTSDYQESYAATILHFVNALQQNTPFETTAAWHLRVLQIVEDTYRYMDSNPDSTTSETSES
jgi:D-apiose dehydrogenase